MATELNRFVFRNGDELFNITNKKVLPADAGRSDLEKFGFLEGQEDQTVRNYIFRSPRRFEIKLVSTWRCNLRCSHCFVLHQLVNRDKGSVDVDKLCGFMSAYFDAFPDLKNGRIQFVGGETALTADKNVEIMDRATELCAGKGVEIMFHSNTNGLELDDDILRFYARLSKFTISLDGPKHLHDAQRKALDDKGSPFDRTMDTIRRLVSAGMRDKIMVQASVSDEGMNKESIVSFYKSLLVSGVKFENINYNVSVPTEWHDPGESFKDARRNPFPVPCCKYRWMSDFTVCTDNNLYCDYFDTTEKNRIGSLSDSIEVLSSTHRRLIEDNMPVLHDPKCQSCPVIGICWGNCCNTYHLHKPSDICDAEGLLKRTQAAASRGELVSFVKGGGSKRY